MKIRAIQVAPIAVRRRRLNSRYYTLTRRDDLVLYMLDYCIEEDAMFWQSETDNLLPEFWAPPAPEGSQSPLYFLKNNIIQFNQCGLSEHDNDVGPDCIQWEAVKLWIRQYTSEALELSTYQNIDHVYEGIEHIAYCVRKMAETIGRIRDENIELLNVLRSLGE